MTVRLPLAVTAPDPSGTYRADLHLLFSPSFPGAADLAAPWRDLSDCPLDPAQMWLDCTIDALSTSAYIRSIACRRRPRGAKAHWEMR